MLKIGHASIDNHPRRMRDIKRTRLIRNPKSREPNLNHAEAVRYSHPVPVSPKPLFCINMTQNQAK